MKIWTSFATLVATSVILNLEGCPPVRAQSPESAAVPSSTSAPMGAGHMDMGGMHMGVTHTPTGSQQATASSGQAAFEALKTLFGKWEAPVGPNKTLVDTFQPFAFGNAILAEEWLGGQQITSTVFYLVGSELRADHYCDYGNQPRYVAVPATDPSVIQFQFREATNLDTHPTHFHSTTWRLTDATHMTQDWNIEGSPKGNSIVHLQFVRTE